MNILLIIITLLMTLNGWTTEVQEENYGDCVTSLEENYTEKSEGLEIAFEFMTKWDEYTNGMSFEYFLERSYNDPNWSKISEYHYHFGVDIVPFVEAVNSRDYYQVYILWHNWLDSIGQYDGLHP